MQEIAGSDEYLLDTLTVREFVRDVRAVVSRAGSPEEAVQELQGRFAGLLADEDWLPPEYCSEAPAGRMGGGIGQWLLFRSGARDLSLFSLVVPPGASTPVHDHLAWGLVGLYAGEQEETVFEPPKEASENLEPVTKRAIRRGRVLSPLAPEGRHPRRQDDLGGRLGLHTPPRQRHRLRLAPLLRAAHGGGYAVQVRLRKPGLRRGLLTRSRQHKHE